jgi:hypothetical protein
MMTDYRTMLFGMAAVQAAATIAAVAVTVRSLEFALREGERAVRAGQPAAPGAGRSMREMPMLPFAESYAEWVRGFAALTWAPSPANRCPPGLPDRAIPPVMRTSPR